MDLSSMITHGPASQDDPESVAIRVAAGMLAHADTIGRSRQLAEDCAHLDPIFAELMATYAELGEVLLTADSGPWFASDCRSLVERLIALGRRMDTDIAQELAALFTRQRIERRAA